MRLSWNEIRARAARFADEWKHASYERGESQTFYNEFFEVFGVTRRRVASFEEARETPRGSARLRRFVLEGHVAGRAEERWPRSSSGKQQALDYFPGLKEHELPRYVLEAIYKPSSCTISKMTPLSGSLLTNSRST